MLVSGRVAIFHGAMSMGERVHNSSEISLGNKKLQRYLGSFTAGLLSRHHPREISSKKVHCDIYVYGCYMMLYVY